MKKNILRFNDSKDEYRIISFQMSTHLVSVKFSDNLEGVIIGNNGFKLLWCGVEYDFSDFTTRYDVFSKFNGAAFSNDGSTETEDNPLIRELSEEAKLQMLEDEKSELINSSVMKLEAFLVANPLKSTVHGGIEKTYSVTKDKQSLMASQYMTYQIEKATNPNAILTWNESGKSCEAWTEEEFLQLILEVKQYVYPMISYQQKLEETIKACTTEEELSNIIIDYSLFSQK